MRPGTPLNSGLYFGQVMHARLAPFEHRFRYKIFSFLIDVDELSTLDKTCRLFSYNRWNVFSFWDRDHGPSAAKPDRGATPRAWVEAALARHGLDDCGARLSVLCFPRVLGYVFNPLSVWFCHRHDGSLGAVVYEVHNTFGDRHSYLIPIGTDEGKGERLSHACRKGFHVSPFMDMEAVYRFALRPPGERVALAIHQSRHDRPQMTATLAGKRIAFGDRGLLAALGRNPLLTWKVIAAIHLQAFKLWRKGAPFFRRPKPPSVPVTLIPIETAAEPNPGTIR